MPKHHPTVAHYARANIELIDYIEAQLSREAYRGYLWGNIQKYLSRYEHKGTPLDDLHKAKTYLEWLIESLEEK